MRITIVVTAFKEKMIEKCLNSILNQKLHEKFEILVVTPDNQTANIVKRIMKKYKKVKLIKDPGRGKPIALNLIFKKVRKKILVLTDGDVVLERNSINYLIEHFKDSNVGAVSGRVIYRISRNSLFYEWAKLSEKIFDRIRKFQDKEGKLWHPTGYLYAIRSGIVSQIPPNALADDALIGYLIKSKGYLIRYEPRAKVYVKFPSKIRDFLNQKSRTRAGFLQLKRWFGLQTRRMTIEISFGFKELLKIYGIKKIHKMMLVGMIYLISWLRAYWLIFKKESFEKIWVRIDTTK